MALKNKLMNFNLPEEAHEYIKSICDRVGLSQSELARTILVPILMKIDDDLTLTGVQTLSKYRNDYFEAKYMLERGAKPSQLVATKPVPNFAKKEVETEPKPALSFVPKAEPERKKIHFWANPSTRPEYDDPEGLLPFAPGEQKSDLTVRLKPLAKLYGLSVIQLEEAMQGTDDISYSDLQHPTCGRKTFTKAFELSPLMAGDVHLRETVTGWLNNLAGRAHTGFEIIAGYVDPYPEQRDDLLAKYN